MVKPAEDAVNISPSFKLSTTSAALFAIPFLTRSGNSFEIAVPSVMPESKSDDTTKLPDPFTARVRSSFETVVTSVAAPLNVKPVEPIVLLVNVSEVVLPTYVSVP
ncbi:MAG: hypothetical protein UR81_C0031G0006 [Candidatus Levybacteria bacterium GW2011_GWB1_35_5]|nr:MAG: hypothetical protein UR81_C0031G0006 [Candidatus Levybacteria bacterium GW2011_GWB1_35_5]